MRNGRSCTGIKKSDKKIIKLYNSIVQEIDENKSHSLRPSYINRVKYTTNYKNNILLLKHQEVNLKR